jgi:transcription elongation factor GreA
MADLKKKEDILLDIGEKLKEEKWTRASIESYSVRNFVDLDNVIRIAIDEKYQEELKELCKENLKHNTNSIVGLYMVGVLQLEESSVDDSYMPQIVKLFMDNRKNKIAEFLAEKMLSYRENKFALKTLEGIFEEQNNQDELFGIRKRLVLIDSRDAQNAKILGDHYEKEGDRDQAMFYYRLAMERFIKARSVKMVEELWNKIIKMYPDDYHLVIAMARKIREVLGDERVGDMVYNDFVRAAVKSEKFKDALKVLKVIIDFKPTDKVFRKAIEDCYREIYATHSELEKYLKISAIGQSWKPHKEAIRLFESHIAFDKGCFVSHKSWGIGVVKDIQNDKVTIDFEGKPNHEMALEIALRALNVLDGDNIVIWKKFKRDDLKKLAETSPLKVLEVILRSNNNECSTAEIKSTLVPDVFSESQWNKWWLITKKQMETSNSIVMSLTRRNIVELRDKEISIVDEIVSRFKKTTNFENKLKLLIDYRTRGGDVNAENATALPNYFLEILAASSESPEKKLVSGVALKYTGCIRYTDTMLDSSVIFAVKNLLELYDQLDIELKKDCLNILMHKIKDWEDKFSDFIQQTPVTRLHNFMLKELADYEKFEIIGNIFASAMNGFQENPELFLWSARVALEESDAAFRDRIGIRDSEIMLRLLSLVDLLNNDIDQKSNVGRSKKFLTVVYDLLWKKELLGDYLEIADESFSKSVVTILHSSLSVKEEAKAQWVATIVSRFPNLKKVDRQVKVKIRHQSLVTKDSFEKKKAELANVMNVEIPENSRAIGEAMEKGDLRENADYKAALERQDQLKAAASKLEKELNEVQVLNKAAVDTSSVDVGTKVVLKNDEGKNETYHILGQWDVDLKRHIISYHSPLGRALLDRKTGDTVMIELNGEEKTFEIVSIDLADFD